MRRVLAILAFCTTLFCITNAASTFCFAAPAAKKNSGHPKSLELNERGVAATNAKDFARAEKLFREALSADQYNLTAAHNLATLYLTNKKPAEAQALLEDYVARYPGDAGLYARLADVYFDNKQLQKALDHYTKALTIDPKFKGVHAKKATILSLFNRVKEAEAELKLAVAENPGNDQLLANLSSVQLANGNVADAIASAKRALQIRPDKEVYITLGTAYEISKEYKNSLIAFERAQDLGDTRPELQKKIDALKEHTSKS